MVTIDVSGVGEYLVCLAADGAGSATEGGEGARIACAEAKAAISACLAVTESAGIDRAGVERWIQGIRAVLEEEARANSLAARDYACTLLGAVISPQTAVFFQIGDGAIVVSAGDALGVVFWPEPGPYANMTNFVTEEDALRNLQVSITNQRIDELALFTDGIQRLALVFEQRCVHPPFFDSMFKVLRRQLPGDCKILDDRLAEFLNGDSINSRTDDDKTLILASRIGS